MSEIELPCTSPGCEYKTPVLPFEFAFQQMNNHRTDAHSEAAPAATTTAHADLPKPEKVGRPSFDLDESSEKWEYFKTRWNVYKAATALRGNSIQIQLMETCSERLRFAMFQYDTKVDQRSEDDILAAMKRLSVKEENVMVSRVNLHTIRQESDEPIRNFSARLRGQAELCRFEMKCPNCDHNNRYTDQMVRDALIRGLYDQDIQREILGLEDQNMELEPLLKLLEAKETGKRTQANILGQSGGAMSSYKNKERQSTIFEKCSYCGNPGHGKNDGFGRNTLKHRREHCPAFNSTCDKCSRKGHLTKLCKQTRLKKDANDNQDSKLLTTSKESAVVKDDLESTYWELCGLTQGELTNDSDELGLVTHAPVSNSNKGGQVIMIEAQQHDRIRGWIRKHPEGHPTITLQARLDPSDYAHFGYKFTKPPRCCNIKAVTDTGCQSTIIGLQQVYNMGYKMSDLVPTKVRMRAIDSSPIEVVGALLLRLSGQDQDGRTLETTQVCYVSDKIKQLYLSEQGCKQLGIIPASFPAVGAALQDPHVSAVKHNSDNLDATPTCTCARRTLPPPLPTTVPFEPTQENREKIEDWIKNNYSGSTFNVCPHQPLPLMEGPPVTIMIDSDAKPVAYHTPIPVPLHWQDKVHADLMQDVALGVIEPVPIGSPVGWCHRMVVTRKKDGNPRRVVDFQSLNKHCARETHHTMSPFHQATLVPAGMKKTVTDAWNGYHSVPIQKEDRHLTTFITPWGRFRYCTLPQGFIAAGDGYSRRFDEIVSDIPHKTKCIDDTVMWSATIEESFHQTCEWLDICGRHGITQNPAKFHFAKDTVEFAGFEITTDSIRPGEKFIRAIRDFPTPRNTTDVRSLFGLINQVSYCLSSSEELRPFRDLLSPSTKFYWDETMDILLDKAKNTILGTIAEGVCIFDKDRKTCLSTDWSKHGLGFSLGQKYCDCTTDEPYCCPTGWKLTFACNRYTHNAEANYAPIEGEALAVAWGLEKARHFVLGCKDLIVATDHKPLLKILSDRHLQDIKNPRLVNLKEKTLPFKYKIIHVPGRRHFTADGISRYPSGDIHPDKMFLPDDVHAMSMFQEDATPEAVFEEELTLCAISTLAAIEAVSWYDVQEATSSDPIMMLLLEMILSGFPERSRDLPEQIRSYFAFREDLSINDGVIMYEDRIVIPPKLRQHILDTIHSAHQGVTSMTARAQSSIFWPGISLQLQGLRETCPPCDRMAPSQPNPPPTPVHDPVYPFQYLCADYFSHSGHYYLIVVDRYSGWPMVYHLPGGSAPLIKKLREIFVTFGIPEELATDGGPEFMASETTMLLTNWRVSHRLSSVAYPHSNCRAEVGVKTVKRMITDNTDSSGDIDIPKFQRAMLQYRNTPSSLDKRSPAEIVFGHQIRDFIPVSLGKYIPHNTWSNTTQDRETALMQRHAKEIEILSTHTRKLPPLKVGDSVRIQNQNGNAPRKWDKSGVVIEVCQFDQYAIKVHGSGRATLRNRKFLRKYVPFVNLPTPARIIESNTNQPCTARNPTPAPSDPERFQRYSTPLRANEKSPALLPPIHSPKMQPRQLLYHTQDVSHNTPSTTEMPVSPSTPREQSNEQSIEKPPTVHDTVAIRTPIENHNRNSISSPIGDSSVSTMPMRPKRNAILPSRFKDYEMQ